MIPILRSSSLNDFFILPHHTGSPPTTTSGSYPQTSPPLDLWRELWNIRKLRRIIVVQLDQKMFIMKYFHWPSTHPLITIVDSYRILSTLVTRPKKKVFDSLIWLYAPESEGYLIKSNIQINKDCYVSDIELSNICPSLGGWDGMTEWWSISVWSPVLLYPGEEVWLLLATTVMIKLRLNHINDSWQILAEHQETVKG